MAAAEKLRQHVLPDEAGAAGQKNMHRSCASFFWTLVSCDGAAAPAKGEGKAQKVVVIFQAALSPAARLPDTFETPPCRQRWSTGTSKQRSPAAAARICISRFQP